MRPAAAPPSLARTRFLVCGLLALAGVLVYANSFGAPFVLDDFASITSNPSIRSLADFGAVLNPPLGETVGGRPLLNLTLAINFAIGGTDPWGYHLFNLVIHLAVGLVLFGILRSTLHRFYPPRISLAIAATTALIWLVHPLQTESVTYVVQRAESLVSLFYLLTLYCVIHSATGARPKAWGGLAVICCAAGMATKEVMVTAPVLVMLYDRIFLAGSFREAWRRRRVLYAGLASTWILLGLLVTMQGRGGGAGLGKGISTGSYLLTQSRAIVHYLRLVFWPHPLVFDYGSVVTHSIASVIPQLIAMGILLTVTVVALRRWPPLGFLAAAFFLLLAPSSSVVPVVGQTIAEHRLYLALAPSLLLLILGLHRVGGHRALAICGLWGTVLGWRTVERNKDYRTNLSLWEVTVRDWPQNTRAQLNYGKALAAEGQSDAAIATLSALVRSTPNYAWAHHDLGKLLAEREQFVEARTHFEAALREDPDFSEAVLNLGIVMMSLGEPEEGVKMFRRAVATSPAVATPHALLGDALMRLAHFSDARKEFETAVQLRPDSLELRVTLGRLFALEQNAARAAEQFAAALSLNPDLAPIHNELGKALARQRMFDEAIREFETALRLEPGLTEAMANLKTAQRLQGQMSKRP